MIFDMRLSLLSFVPRRCVSAFFAVFAMLVFGAVGCARWAASQDAADKRARIEVERVGGRIERALDAYGIILYPKPKSGLRRWLPIAETRVWWHNFVRSRTPTNRLLLDRCSISLEQARSICHLVGCYDLSLRGVNASSESVALLIAMPELQSINLAGVTMDESIWLALERAPNLRLLLVPPGHESRQAKLSALHPQCEVLVREYPAYWTRDDEVNLGEEADVVWLPWPVSYTLSAEVRP